MYRTELIKVRIDAELKANAEAIFEDLGLTTTEAILLFYKQVELNHGMPFPVKILHHDTEEILEEPEVR
ncbi:MAG: type II toxin-antitoxin system RelB/DinJ family antitoxin [Gomphosphaeria aponina SAG 52.96 = DSM 107014]|uniref:Type II toxin-antitoxin system RelB/DinJ family antitoxin n=1 Tax=Gomphosphaeria aponina SAG 52.96 = DSM 107014 TaxID=1521640 RepID=A0A941GXN7_9CHRO|nr:type II toxin-antitoxin system RelB/DinJ family antitoxin [Gomphosphaeria aponina SAG 52.96 = DSM 107014]